MPVLAWLIVAFLTVVSIAGIIVFLVQYRTRRAVAMFALVIAIFAALSFCAVTFLGGSFVISSPAPRETASQATQREAKETLGLFMEARIHRKDSDVLNLLTGRLRAVIVNTANIELLQVSNPCWYRYEILQMSQQSATEASARVRMYEHQWGGDVMGTLPQSWEQAVGLALTSEGWRVDRLGPAENRRVEPAEPHGPTTSACTVSR